MRNNAHLRAYLVRVVQRLQNSYIFIGAPKYSFNMFPYPVLFMNFKDTHFKVTKIIKSHRYASLGYKYLVMLIKL